MSNASTPSSSSSGHAVPRVGGVRCYWALVTPKFPVPGMHESKLALKFVHPDPVLGAHLARQQMTMVGRDMLDFIHPNERDQARADLGGAISSNDLQGSVTRVRFARLSRIREILGGTRDEIEYPSDAKTFVEDDEYLILDLVLNWVADGLLLAFFHAIRDKDPVGNNDPSKKNEEWTNFCGTANMPEDQLEALHANLTTTLPSSPQTNYPPTRVFQLHTTAASPTRPDQLVFSWPPPRQPNVYAQFDGRYDALEYADLMKGVDMDPSALQMSTPDVRTNCTTRFGATHSLTSEGVYRVISSVFIPYGNLIFACFQTIKLVAPSSSSSRSPTTATRNEYVATPPPPQATWPSPEEEEQFRTPDRPREVDYKAKASMDAGASNGHGHGHGHPYDYPRDPDGYEYDRTPYHLSAPIPPPHHPHAHAHHTPPSHHLPPTAYPHHHDYPHPPHPAYHEYESTPHTPHAPPFDHNHNHGHGHPSSYPPPPPPPSHPQSGHAYQHDPQVSHPDHTPPSASSRPLIPPPNDVEKCVICGTRESPEWRRNESGIKDLCNACGLRLARQVAKREGRQKPRKKKDKV